MNKYKNIFIDYVKEHLNEIKYCGERWSEFSYSSYHVFKLRCPKKFLGIFPTNYKFIIYDKPDDIRINKYFLVDISTLFHTGIRLDYNEDAELIKLLAYGFVKAYNKYRKKIYIKRFKNIVK